MMPFTEPPDPPPGFRADGFYIDAYPHLGEHFDGLEDYYPESLIDLEFVVARLRQFPDMRIIVHAVATEIDNADDPDYCYARWNLADGLWGCWKPHETNDRYLADGSVDLTARSDRKERLKFVIDAYIKATATPAPRQPRARSARQDRTRGRRFDGRR
ncbi:MAG TPA: hypothetical protein VGL71_01800 [Urbifossiella sp.]